MNEQEKKDIEEYNRRIEAACQMIKEYTGHLNNLKKLKCQYLDKIQLEELEKAQASSQKKEKDEPKYYWANRVIDGGYCLYKKEWCNGKPYNKLIDIVKQIPTFSGGAWSSEKGTLGRLFKNLNTCIAMINVSLGVNRDNIEYRNISGAIVGRIKFTEGIIVDDWSEFTG